MPINVKCQMCGKTYALGEPLAGKLVRCPTAGCGATIRVPGGASVQEALPAVLPVPRRQEEVAPAGPPPLPVATRKRFDPDADWAEEPTPKRPSVNISPDLDGSPRPDRKPVMVMSMFGIMGALTVVVLVLLVAGGIVLAGKIDKTIRTQSPESIDDALDRIAKGSPAKRLKAVEWLNTQPVDEAKRARVSSALIGCLSQKDLNLRQAAVRASGRWLSPDDIPALTKLSTSPDQAVAFAARQVLEGPNLGRGALVARAKTEIKALEQAVTAYYANHKYWPQSLTVLTQRDQEDGSPASLTEKALIDPWGNQYIYDANVEDPQTHKPLIYSNGPPGENRPIRNWGDW